MGRGNHPTNYWEYIDFDLQVYESGVDDKYSVSAPSNPSSG
jgi:hypothetical protein